VSSSVTTRNTCHYLFNEEAHYFSDFLEEEVNPLFESMIKVIDYLASIEEAFFLFDPMSMNHQCHIYALIAAKLFAGDKGVDRRFLYHFFFLSLAFVNDSKLLVEVFNKASKQLGIEVTEKFLKDSSGKRVFASRVALNRLFIEYMKKEVAYSEELSLIAQADETLFLPAPKCSLYTFPKFPGVIYFIDAIAKESIPVVFKIQVIAKEGLATFFHTNYDVAEIDPKKAVIVFDLVASSEEMSVSDCLREAKKCSAYSQRYLSQKSRHPVSEKCFFCMEEKIDPHPYQEQFSAILRSEERLLHAVAADFTEEVQSFFLPLLDRCEKLGALFRESLADVERCHLSGRKPLHMSVHHVYPEMLERAVGGRLVMSANYRDHCVERGLV